MSLNDLANMTPDQWKVHQAGVVDRAISQDTGVLEAEQGPLRISGPKDRISTATSKSLARGGLNILSGMSRRAGEAAQLDPSPMIGLGARPPAKLPVIQENDLSDHLKMWSTALFNEGRAESLAPELAAGRFKKFFTQTLPEVGPYMAVATLSTLAAGPAGGFLVGSAVEGNNHYRKAKADLLKGKKDKDGAWIRKPMSEKDAERIAAGEAEIVGFISGAIEAAQVSGVINFAKKPAAAAFKKLMTARTLKQMGSAVGTLTMAEAQLYIQEALEEGLQSATSQGMGKYGHGGEFSWNEVGEDALQGGNVALFLGTAGGIAKSPFVSDQASESAVKILSEEEIKQQEVEVQAQEEAKIEKKIRRRIVADFEPIETEDTPDGSPPLETKTNATIKQQSTVVNNVAEGKPPMDGVVSPKQAVSGAILEEMGQTIPSRGKESFAQWMQEASNAGLNKRESAIRIAEEIAITGRALTRQESAGLTMAVVDVRNELDVIERRIADMAETEGADVDVEMASLERLQKEQSRLTTTMASALYDSGGEQARDFVARKIAVSRAGDLVQMKSQARVNKKAPLTEKETKAFEDQSKELDKVKKELSALQKKDSEANAEKIFKSLKKKRKVSKKKSSKKKADTKTEMTLQEKAAEVRKLFEEGCAP
ncbi:MAG: hypothetical protein GY941_21595 [Planctomycetes bacterium]|nr:hypothetical protein [Planctomycetota bacterium]